MSSSLLPVAWVVIALVIAGLNWKVLDGGGWGLPGDIGVCLVAAVGTGLLLHRCACDTGSDLLPDLGLVALVTASAALLTSLLSGGKGGRWWPLRKAGE